MRWGSCAWYLSIMNSMRSGSWPKQSGSPRKWTASWDEGHAPINRPGPKYLQVITRGLKETFGLSDEGVVEYLKDVAGIQGLIREGELAKVVGDSGA